SAFLEDGALDALHRAVGLRSASPDEAVRRAVLLHRLAEGRRSKLGAVVGGDGAQGPAGGGQIASDAMHQGAGVAHRGIEWRDVDLGPDKGTGDFNRRLPDPAFGPRQPAD